MRTILISQEGAKYVTYFLENKVARHSVTSYLIEPLEVMVDWIEKGILPKYSYR